MANNLFSIKIEETQINVGERLKFADGWRDSAGILLSAERQFVVLGSMVKLVRWHESGPPDVIAAKPGEDLPEADELNAGIPKEDWSLDFSGNPRPPWARWYVVVLLDAV